MPGSAFDPSPPVADPWTDKLGRFVDSVAFQRFILGSILAAAVIVGLEADRSLMARYGGLIYALDWTVLGIFIVEAILKIARHGRHGHRYFKDPWNVFDFTIVVVCLLPFQGHYAAVLRLARVLRALRLVSSVPRLQLLVGSLMRSIPSMGYIGMLLGILFYIYAVLGVFLFRDNDPVHFGNLPTAALSLFRVVTLEDWTDIMYTQMLGSDIYPPENVPPEIELRPGAMPLVGAVYFISFVLLGTMIMLNLFIGVIIKSMEEAQDDQAANAREKHMAASGHLTLGDELVLLEKDLEALQRRVRSLKDQTP